jgi:hypothetical protein
MLKTQHEYTKREQRIIMEAVRKAYHANPGNTKLELERELLEVLCYLKDDFGLIGDYEREILPC